MKTSSILLICFVLLCLFFIIRMSIYTKKMTKSNSWGKSDKDLISKLKRIR